MIPLEVMTMSTTKQSTKKHHAYLWAYNLPSVLHRVYEGQRYWQVPFVLVCMINRIDVLLQWKPWRTDSGWHIFTIVISRTLINICSFNYLPRAWVHIALCGLLPWRASDWDIISLKLSVTRQMKIHVTIYYLPVILKMDDYVPQDQTVKVDKDFGDTHVTETSNLEILYGGKYLITYMI